MNQVQTQYDQLAEHGEITVLDTPAEPPTLYLGIDPGKSGAIAALNNKGDVFQIHRCDNTEADIAASMMWFAHGWRCFAVLEQVSAMPKQGVSSTFKFGTSFGFLRGCLACAKIPFETYTPGIWQRYMRCLSKGDKNVTKAAAQRLFPNVKIIHATADALLIAEFCRRSRTMKLFKPL